MQSLKDAKNFVNLKELPSEEMNQSLTFDPDIRFDLCEKVKI